MSAGHSKWSFFDPKALARLSRLELNARQTVVGSFAGRHKSPHRGSSIEFAQYRKYVPGDDIKHIDWTIYAKSDRFYIKEFEADTNLRCHLVVDCSGSMGYEYEHGSKFDYACRIGSLIAQMAVQQGDAVGLQGFTEKLVYDIPARSNARHLGNIFNTLEEIKPEGETNIVGVLHDLAEKIRRRAMIVVFSDFFTDVTELLDCFQHLRYRQHDLVVFHLMDDQEIDFAFDRPTRFMDVEGPASVIADPQLIKGSYKKAVDEYLQALRRGCGQFNVDYRFCNLSMSYEEAVSKFLLERHH